MKNIHVLPTDKPSEFYSIDGKHKLANSTMAMDWYISSVGYKPHNIYITSDEEIKRNDYWINVDNNTISNGEMFELANDAPSCKKIILTTDQDLIDVQSIDNEFLEWFVKNPSCEEVEVFQEKHHAGEVIDESYPKGFFDYKIIIPKKELGGIPKGTITMVIGKSKQDEVMERFIANAKQETLEEVAERIYTTELVMDVDISKDLQLAFINGVKWQQETRYSEKEVLDILVKAIKDVKVKQLTFYDGGSEYPIYSNLSKWFEKYKKK